MGWQILVGAAAGLQILWLVMLGVLWRAQRGHPDKTPLREALRLIPDVVRLLRRLAADRALPRGCGSGSGCCCSTWSCRST